MIDLNNLPEPPVPADCDLRDFARMPLDVQLLRDSSFAKCKTSEEFRAGVMLWCAAWHQLPAASLPDDDSELSALAGYGFSLKAWRKVRTGALFKFIKCRDGRLYHPEIAKKAKIAWNEKLIFRWRRECDRIRKHNKRHDTQFAEPDFETWKQNDGLSESPSRPAAKEAAPEAAANMSSKDDLSNGQPQPVPPDNIDLSAGQPPAVHAENTLKGKGKGKGKGIVRLEPKKSDDRGYRLPDTWEPDANDCEFARTRKLDPAETAGRFRDYWHAAAGPTARKRDWSAAWRFWCRKEIPVAAKPETKSRMVCY